MCYDGAVLVEFAVTNYRSFGERAAIDLRAVDDLNHPTGTVTEPLDGVGRLLRIAAVYGANGAGKSNLVSAIEDANALLLGDKPSRLRPFQSSRARGEPTTFEFTWWAGTLWRWLVSVSGNDVIREELHRGDQPFVLRSGGASGGALALEVAGGADPRGRARIEFVASAAGSGQTAMSHMLRANVPELVDLTAAVRCFFTVGTDWTGGNIAETLQKHPEFAQFASRLLDEAAGLDGIELVAGAPAADGTPSVTMMGLHEFDGSRELLQWRDESEGTQRLAQLAVVMYVLCGEYGGFRVVVDELERSLHPLLTKNLIERYLSQPAPESQLLFTTHDESLLDHLPTDAIWFAEKGPDSRTRLHSLADFDQAELAKYRGGRVQGYLRGRFGGIAPRLRPRP